MHDEGRALEPGEELEHLAVVLQELLLGVHLTPAQLFLEVFLHLGVLLGHPLVSDCRGPLVILVRLCGALRLSRFFVEFPGVVIAVVEVDGPAVERDCLSEPEIVGSEEFPIFLDVLLALEELALGDARVLEFLLIDGDGVVLEVEEHLHLTVAAVLAVALHHALLEISEEAQHVAVEVDPVRLVKLRGVAGGVLGVEVIVGGGEEGSVVDHWFFVGGLTGQGVPRRLLLVDVAVLLLLLRAHLLVVLLELLRGRKSRQQWKVRRHRFYNLLP